MGRSNTHGVQRHFHGIVQKKPIHNVKDEPMAKCLSVRLSPWLESRGKLVAYILEDKKFGEWWSLSGSNR